MDYFSRILRNVILSINWVVMSVISILLVIPFFHDSDFEAIILAFVILGVALVFHKLINLMFENLSFQAALRNRGLSQAIYRQNKRFSSDELGKLSRLGLDLASSGKVAQSYALPKGEKFSVSSADWYLINSLNYLDQKQALDVILTKGIEHWAFINQSSLIHNYLIHPHTMEKSKGNHIIVTAQEAGEVTTEKNLDNAYKKSLSAYKELHPTIIDFKLDLIHRPKTEGMSKSRLSILTLPNRVEDVICIHGETTHYTIASIANKSNRDVYRRTMFEIVDSLTIS